MRKTISVKVTKAILNPKPEARDAKPCILKTPASLKAKTSNPEAQTSAAELTTAQNKSEPQTRRIETNHPEVNPKPKPLNP